jgi:hypothetical protein
MGEAPNDVLKAGNACNPGPPAGLNKTKGDAPLKLLTVFRHNLN